MNVNVAVADAPEYMGSTLLKHVATTGPEGSVFEITCGAPFVDLSTHSCADAVDALHTRRVRAAPVTLTWMATNVASVTVSTNDVASQSKVRLRAGGHVVGSDAMS